MANPIFQQLDECCGQPVDDEGLCVHTPTHTMMSPAEAARRLAWFLEAARAAGIDSLPTRPSDATAAAADISNRRSGREDDHGDD